VIKRGDRRRDNILVELWGDGREQDRVVARSPCEPAVVERLNFAYQIVLAQNFTSPCGKQRKLHLDITLSQDELEIRDYDVNCVRRKTKDIGTSGCSMWFPNLWYAIMILLKVAYCPDLLINEGQPCEELDVQSPCETPINYLHHFNDDFTFAGSAWSLFHQAGSRLAFSEPLYHIFTILFAVQAHVLVAPRGYDANWRQVP